MLASILVLFKIGNKSHEEICHLDFNSKQHDNCKFALKFIQLIAISTISCTKSQRYQLCVKWENLINFRYTMSPLSDDNSQSTFLSFAIN